MTKVKRHELTEGDWYLDFIRGLKRRLRAAIRELEKEEKYLVKQRRDSRQRVPTAEQVEAAGRFYRTIMQPEKGE